jgi:hypothetical protein
VEEAFSEVRSEGVLRRSDPLDVFVVPYQSAPERIVAATKTATTHVSARHPQNKATARRSGMPSIPKTNELRPASTTTAASIVSVAATERKLPWVMATHHTLPGPESPEEFIDPTS